MAGVMLGRREGGLHSFRRAHGPGYVGLAATAWVPKGAQLPILSLNDHSDPFQGRNKGFGKSRMFENFQVPQKGLKDQQLWGFRGPLGPDYMGLAATARVPKGGQLPVVSPNDHLNPVLIVF